MRETRAGRSSLPNSSNTSLDRMVHLARTRFHVRHLFFFRCTAIICDHHPLLYDRSGYAFFFFYRTFVQVRALTSIRTCIRKGGFLPLYERVLFLLACFTRYRVYAGIGCILIYITVTACQ
ncbi:uncharacterized protein EV420DRAFT_221884 [Desarmillaria tabescens]|uniref:Uncharacterized protein n=1 Tax=Armillaria tabescens TaxID=1929756 RepID=A0AA39TQN3_ARMTA|nr:uncharacterized protein EV420DRAFT_221884 [Desarmillaria tabescens]KAK0460649.1 hypothetical protein EV420DRAFT_221884 [Desarmillaria tabescens]